MALGPPQGGRSPLRPREEDPPRGMPRLLRAGTGPRQLRTAVFSLHVTGTRSGPHVSLSLTEFRREGRARLHGEPALSEPPPGPAAQPDPSGTQEPQAGAWRERAAAAPGLALS